MRADTAAEHRRTAFETHASKAALAIRRVGWSLISNSRDRR